MEEKSFIIGMSDNIISKKYMDITIPEIERVLFQKPILWEAITPKTLPKQPLKFFPTKPTIGTPFSREMTPTEKSVWYSHFLLWEYIYKEKINSWIFEHDVNLSKTEILIKKSNKDIINYNRVGGVHCYYLTINGAKQLYDNAIRRNIHYQVDSFIYFLKKYSKEIKQISHTEYLEIGQLDCFGNTINHQPSFSTYSHQE